jgi:hypothetical protein
MTLTAKENNFTCKFLTINHHQMIIIEYKPLDHICLNFTLPIGAY